jgi:hypothetical protein
MSVTGARPVHLEVTAPAPLEAAVGSAIVIRLRASCSAGHERCGMDATLVAPDGAESSHAFVTHRDGVSETGDIALTLPPSVGEHAWRFVLPAHEIAGVRYAEAEYVVPVRAVPQAASLAVWDIPSPVVVASLFTVKAGAKSSADCELKGRGVEILSGAEVVARGALGDVPWQGTAALYWTELPLVAPAEPGMASWTVRFEADGLELPHGSASSTFGIAIVPPPDHKLTVKVIEKDTAAPIEQALVRLGAYRAETGRAGLAEIRLPKGRYELNVWKAGYEIQPTTLDLDKDASVELEALVVPEEDPDAFWTR